MSKLDNLAAIAANLDTLPDTDILLALSDMKFCQDYTNRINFYSYARLLRLKLGLTLADAASVFGLSALTVRDIENGVISGNSVTAIKYRTHLCRLLHRCNGFVEIYFVRDIKKVFKKAYTAFADSRPVIPYVLQECLAKQSLLAFNDKSFDENQTCLILEASEQFYKILGDSEDEV